MREKCTKENPSDGKPWKWFHPDAVEIDHYDGWEDGSSYDKYECPHCGIKFKRWIGK